VAARLRAVPDPTVRRLPATPARPRLRDLPLLAVTAAVLVALAVPLASLVLGSLRYDGRWTLAFYRSLQSDGGGLVRVPITEALGNSLRIGAEASALSLTLGLLVAVVVTRRSRSRVERRLRSVFDGLFMVPLGVSAVTLGFGFLITLDHPPLDLRESPWLVPIAQALVAMPLVVRILVPVLAGLDDRQRQAAASLGASPLRAALVVDVPALWRPLLASAGFAFAVSLGEFGATSFLVRPETPTLPVVIYRLVGSPGHLNYGAAMAASVILAATAAAVVLVIERLRVPGVGSL
ncbi:MAG TPA: ABC transporter permease subunit, partial [Nocardioides sp.]|nr:ABC transporter permease subunit [Nocardioides sp.]